MSRALRLFCLAAFAITLVHNVDAHNGDAHSTIKFAPCAEDATLECGKLTLPINHAKPHVNNRGATSTWPSFALARPFPSSVSACWW